MSGPQHQHFSASIGLWKLWGVPWIEELAKRKPKQNEWEFLLTILRREGKLLEQGHYSDLKHGEHSRMPEGSKPWTYEEQPQQSTPGAEQYTPEWRLLVRDGFVYIRGNDWIR